MTKLLERYRGAILGLACGDAVGTTVEFSYPDSFTPLTDMVGGGPFDLEPGQWTDDTSMMICLGTSIVQCDGFDALDQMRKYVDWCRNGYMSSTGECFDIGATVAEALRKFEATQLPYCGSTDAMASGNGSLMRLAPVPLAYFSVPEQALNNAELSSRTTHASTIAVDACRLMTALVMGALSGLSKEAILKHENWLVDGYWKANKLCPEIEVVAQGSYKHLAPPDIRGTGYAAKSLEAALWAFYRSDSFEEGCLIAANLGEDADTTAAIYGQLAGAFYGVESIPGKWLEKLCKRDLLEKLADDLYTFSARQKV